VIADIHVLGNTQTHTHTK